MNTLVLAFLQLEWDFAIRGILIVAVSFVILCGSVYMLLATNTGVRLGFLIAAAGLFGWMFLMAATWWIYAIGLVGEGPSWEIEQVVTHDDPEVIEGAALDEAEELDDWDHLEPDDPSRGEAVAAADAALTGDGRWQAFEGPREYAVIDVHETGGSDRSTLLGRLPGPEPAHYAIVQVQPVVAVEVEFGAAPPPAEVDEDAPVYSVIMVRDQGSERLPPAVVTISSLLIFGVLCNMLHRRDKLSAKALAEAA